MKKTIKPDKSKGEENLNQYIECQKQRAKALKKVLTKLNKNKKDNTLK